MSNEAAKARLAELLDTAETHMANLAEAQRQRAELTATASTARGRVTVTVDAEGKVIETVFASGIEEMGHQEIAQAFTAAAQQAAATVQRKATELMAPLQQELARLPSLSEIVPGLPDLAELLPEPPEVSTAPPAARARAGTDDAQGMQFRNVEEYDHTRSGPKSATTDTSW
ncbi:YbaB/EbfC family nucleoid-associated protein [Nocardia iowensis]|nr:YbaB/EbfC family nucleoid-associated protein [Nocardia iowensis]